MPGTLWVNEKITLYHGTLRSSAMDILDSAVILGKCRRRSDFSRGFYTTTSRTQAVSFANSRYTDACKFNPNTQDLAALLSWRVDRTELGAATDLVFVRPDDNYWSFVSTCRAGVTRHNASGYYDVAYGPVNLRFEQKLALRDSDQISFHTPLALGVLQKEQPICLYGTPYLAI